SRMPCPSCRHDNPEGASFCGECGARLAALCPSCNAANAPSNKFCHNCGTRLAAAPAAPPPPAGAPTVSERFADPHTYTPKHLAEKMLTSNAAITGERKQVTVHFTDTSGFTPISERLDPAEAPSIMDR